MFAITISEKGGETRRLEFDQPEVSIGRVQGNDVILPKGNVSKRHSKLVLKEDKCVIVDLKSTNGTFVNGRKISSPVVLKGTDKVYIGDFVLAIAEPAAAPQPEAARTAPPTPPAPARRGTMPPPPLPRRTVMAPAAPEPLPPEPEPAFEPAIEPAPRPAPRAARPPTMSVGSPKAPAPAVAAPAPIAAPPAPAVAAPPAPVAARPVAPTPRPEPDLEPTPIPAGDPFLDSPDEVGDEYAALDGAASSSASGPSARARLAALAAVSTRLLDELGVAALSLSALREPELRQRAEQLAAEVVAELEQEDYPSDALARDAVAEALDVGPIATLLADGAVIEVRVPRHDRIYARRAEDADRFVRVEGFYSSPEALARAVARLTEGAADAASAGYVEARLDDGTLLTAVVAPLARHGAALTLRRPHGGTATLAELAEAGAMSSAMADLLSLAVRERRNVLVVGATARERAALLGALALVAEPEELVVLLSDGGSGVEVDGAVVLHTTHDGGAQTLQAALRLHPDRLVIADAHAASAALEALVAAPGAIIAAPGTSAADGVGRLLAGARLAGMLPDAALRDTLADHLHLIVHVARGGDGAQRVLRIAELERFDDRGRPRVADVFTWKGDESGRYTSTGHIPAFAEGAPSTMFRS